MSFRQRNANASTPSADAPVSWETNFLSTSVHFANKRRRHLGYLNAEKNCQRNGSLEANELERALHPGIQGNSVYGHRCSKLPEVIAKLYSEKVHSVDLSYNDLVTTRGLERFIYLRELVLDNNQLSDSIIIPYLPQLHTLSLNKNLLNDIELLMDKLAHSLPALTFLSLLGNKACPNQLSDIENDDVDYERYRYYVLNRLPQLEFLDSSRITPQERHTAATRGYFMKVVRPKADYDAGGGGDSRSSTLEDSPPPSFYSPLPRHMRRPEEHKGAYSKCKYKYSGKHSEGNRFILNSDL